MRLFGFITNFVKNGNYFQKFLVVCFLFFIVLSFTYLGILDFSLCQKGYSPTYTTFESEEALKQYLQLEQVKAREAFIKQNWVLLRDHEYLREFVAKDEGVPINFSIKHLGFFVFYLFLAAYSQDVQPNGDLSVFYPKLILSSIVVECLLYIAAEFFGVDAKIYDVSDKSAEDAKSASDQNKDESEGTLNLSRYNDPDLDYIANLSDGFNLLGVSLMFVQLINSSEFTSCDSLRLFYCISVVCFNYFLINDVLAPEIETKIVDTNEIVPVIGEDSIDEDCISTHDKFIESLLLALMLICE